MANEHIELIARETNLNADTITRVEKLFDEGNTIPFVARYRKEQTGGLDEVALASIRDRLDYYQDLAERKKTILDTIEKQGKLTENLKKTIETTFDKFKLEDLYLPYKPKRRTRAQVARELGLEPLAERIYKQEDRDGDPMEIVAVYGKSVKLENPEEALKGALDIVAEWICETPEIRQHVRDLTWREGVIKTRMLVDKKESSGKFDAFDKQSESVRDIPSHRMLAVFRGSKEKELAFRIAVDEHEVFSLLDSMVQAQEKSIWQRHIMETIRDSYDRLLAPQIETEIRNELKQRADETAIEVFASNLSQLLLAPPFMGKVVLAIDPGLRTGCKLAVLDRTGKLLKHATIFPLAPKNDLEGSFAIFDKFRKEYGFGAFAVGNGTGGKEMFRACRQYVKERELGDSIIPVLVNESGASIYSASEIARAEFPDLDLTVRGSVSIGRRMQDPLAELVKIDPKSIGVGQYQHDVDQKLLARKLDEVVEFCVNSVGVDLNTASAPLLSRVAGLSARVAQNIIETRNQKGAFASRKTLLEVPQFGEKTFQQAAGFLRVVGDDPLDNSAVHPERYELVRRIAADLGVDVKDLIGNSELLAKVNKSAYLSDDVGEFTINDIIDELAKPNRDPRSDFRPPDFSDEINDISDLEEGMVLSGVVSNVAKFGVFVDIGVHQDGMIHVSELDHRYIDDPAKVLKVGDEVSVKVIELDRDRKRIGLSRKQLIEPPKHQPKPQERDPHEKRSDESRGNRRPDKRGPKGKGKPQRSQQADRGKSQPKDVIAAGRFGSALLEALKKDDK